MLGSQHTAVSFAVQHRTLGGCCVVVVSLFLLISASSPVDVVHVWRRRGARRDADGHDLDKSIIVDTLTPIDMKLKVLKLLRRSKELAVGFCDRCAQVCDSGCRAEAVRERARMRALRFGVRI